MSSKLLCTSTYTVDQKPNIRFKCLQCNIFICKTCAEKCHKPHSLHEVVFHGRTEFDCQCFQHQQKMEEARKDKSTSECQTFRCIAREPYPYHVDIGDFMDDNDACCDISDQHVDCGTGISDNNSNSSSITTSGDATVCRGSDGKRKMKQRHTDIFSASKIKDWCSYMLTSTYSVFQELYECKTCGIFASNSQGICELCINSCHQDHDVNPVAFVKHGYCACGAGHLNSAGKTIKCNHYRPKQRIVDPPNFGQHSGVAHGNSLYFFGGAFDYVTNDCYEFNYVDCVWYKITQRGDIPGIRSAHSAVVVGDYMYIFGGVCGHERYNSIYRFEFSSYNWCKLVTSGKQPSPKYFTTLVSAKNNLYVFGGMLGEDKGDNRLYKFDLNTSTWSEVETSGECPPKTNGCSALVYNNKIYLFGGFNHDTLKFSNNLYEIDIMTKKWTKINSIGKVPFRRAYHTAVLYRNSMFLFGGKKPASSGENKEYLYEYKFAENKWYEWAANEEVTNVFFHAAVVAKHSMYVLGGNDRLNHHYKFYEYSFLHEKWSRIVSKTPTLICRNFLKTLFHEKSYYDIIFRVKDENDCQEFKAHACIVSQCNYLQQRILEMQKKSICKTGETYDSVAKDENALKLSSATSSASSEERDVTLIEIADVKPKVFYQILCFLYGSETLGLSAKDGILLDIFVVARQFELNILCDKCLDSLQEYITKDNVLNVLKQLQKVEFVSEIRQHCMTFIQQHYNDIVSQDEMEQLPGSLVLEIARLKADTSNMVASPNMKTVACIPHNDGIAAHALLTHLKHLRQTGDMSDVILTTKEAKFKAHKAILACSCDYFSSLFNGEFIESKKSVIEMHNVSANALSQLLDFIYTGQLTLPSVEKQKSPDPGTGTSSEVEESLDNCSEDDNSSTSRTQNSEALSVSSSNCQLLLELASVADMLALRELEEVCRIKITHMIEPWNVYAMLQFCALSEHKLRYIIKKTCRDVLMHLPHEKLVDMFVDCAMNREENVIIDEIQKQDN